MYSHLDPRCQWECYGLKVCRSCDSVLCKRSKPRLLEQKHIPTEPLVPSKQAFNQLCVGISIKPPNRSTSEPFLRSENDEPLIQIRPEQSRAAEEIWLCVYTCGWVCVFVCACLTVYVCVCEFMCVCDLVYVHVSVALRGRSRGISVP